MVTLGIWGELIEIPEKLLAHFFLIFLGHAVKKYIQQVCSVDPCIFVFLKKIICNYEVKILVMMITHLWKILTGIETV